MDKTEPTHVQNDNDDLQFSEGEIGEHSEDELERLLEESFHQEDERCLEEWQVLTHIFKAFVGTGILGLPSAVMHGGIIVGPLILVFLGFICMYNIKLLVDTARNVRETLGITRISYSGTVEHLFHVYGKRAGALARVSTDFLLCTLQLGFCCVYFVFISHNIQVVVGKLDVRIWMVMILPLILIPSLITNISRLAYLTVIGNAIVLFGMGIIYHYLLTNLDDPRTFPQYNGFINMCVSFGQVVYAFEGIAVVLPTENQLKKRESFDWLMKLAATAVMILYASMGILGYLTFGDITLGSITLNLPQTKMYQSLQIFFAVMVYFTYPLQLLVSVDIIKGYINFKKLTISQQRTYDILIRTILVVTTCLMAVCIPQLDNFMALVGSISGVAVGLVLPPICHMVCFWNQGITKLRICINVSIVILGIFACITGTSSTIYSIMHRFVHFPEATKYLTTT